MRVRSGSWWAVCLTAVTLTGCGAAAEQPSQDIERLEQRVKDAEQKAADAQATAAESSKSTKQSDDGATSDPVTDDTPDESSSSGSNCIKVPNVVGKDHQLAQDTMQAAGLYVLQEEDASGQGRLLILDRNWTTVRQRPKAGKCVSEDTEIMLYAVKDEER
jgi:hypothetical protein